MCDSLFLRLKIKRHPNQIARSRRCHARRKLGRSLGFFSGKAAVNRVESR